MTPRQRELARHALGLPNARKRSYRNRFIAGWGHRDFDDWRAMAEAGMACNLGAQRDMTGAHYFMLTPVGARAALDKRERLDPEDFPTEARANG